MCNWLVGFGSEQLKESFALIIWGSNSLQAHGHPTLISVQVGAEALGHGDREQGMAALQSPNHVLPRAESVPSEAHGNTGTGALPVSCAGTDTAKGSLPSLWGKNVPKSFVPNVPNTSWCWGGQEKCRDWVLRHFGTALSEKGSLWHTGV